MGRDPKFDILFEPVRIGPKVLKNRFVQTAHCTGAGSDRPEFQAAFRGMKAEGGWGAVSTEYCSIAPETDDTNRISARLWDDGDTRNLSRMCDAAHAYGALAAVELWHGGAFSLGLEAREVARSVGQTPGNPQFARGSVEMNKDDIRDVRDLYGAATCRAVAAGFDIITLYAAHGFALPYLFLLPLFNHRKDEYGGSFDNRCRFTREVLETIHLAAEGKCAISLRFGIDTLDNDPRGLAARDEGTAFIEALDDLVDFWDITAGMAEPADAPPSRTHAENHLKQYVAGVKDVTRKPVMTVGRFTNPDTMVEVIRSGQADIIGAARPSIADPFLPRKIEEGRIDDIRECIGCNVCLSRWEIGGPPIICTQNATAGEEFRRGWHPERFAPARNRNDSVLIIGAGPAGLECALVLARRGIKRIHVVDAAAEAGGAMRWTTQLPGLGEWARVISHRTGQLKKYRNVELVLEATMDTDAALAYGGEIIVVATGSRWLANGMNPITQAEIPGARADAPHVVTPEQLMVEGKTVAGEHALVYDCDGYFVAVGLAELLAQRGHRVTVATPFERIAPYTRFTLEAPAIRQLLRANGIRMRKETLVNAIDENSVALTSLEGDEEETIDADTVVLVTQREPLDHLYHDLRDDPHALAANGVRNVFRIGDCVAPQLVADAVFSGHRLAREIDSPDPSRPMPFTRERPDVRTADFRGSQQPSRRLDPFVRHGASG
jgi:dimethylamine/trimethylamine dehydrogenase